LDFCCLVSSFSYSSKFFINFLSCLPILHSIYTFYY
jgi:hypothetical protein